MGAEKGPKMEGNEISSWSEAGKGSPLEVLLVDDEEDILNLAKIYLQKEVEFSNLEVTNSPKEALRKLEDKEYDVIVSDYKMPEMNGIEFLDSLRERGGETPFILFTGRGSEKIAMKALNRGASGYVTKKSDSRTIFKKLSQKILKSVEVREERVIAEKWTEDFDEASGIGRLAFESEIFEKGFEELREAFLVISKEGSLEILDAARSNLRSTRNIWHDFGLSKRQYYSRLRSLRKTGMIKKKGEGYVLTELGRKAIQPLFELGLLIKSATRGEEDVLKILEDRELKNYFLKRRPFSLDLEIRSKLRDVTDYESCMSEVNYEAFVSEIVKMIRESDEELLFALSFADQRILRAFLGVKENVDLRIVASKKALYDVEEISRNLLSREEIEELTDIFGDSTRKCRRLPFSFLLQDNRRLNVEIRNPLYPNNFFRGVLFEGKEVYGSFLDLFNELYDGAEKSQFF